jgi:uncharacterized BrkB/YihY/UPF0761 family membrane protein
MPEINECWSLCIPLLTLPVSLYSLFLDESKTNEVEQIDHHAPDSVSLFSSIISKLAIFHFSFIKVLYQYVIFKYTFQSTMYSSVSCSI